MELKEIKDLMVSLDDYAVVPEDATFREAVLALDTAQKRLPSDKHRHRAVLVRDAQKRVIGKIGLLAFLRALEPGSYKDTDIEAVSRPGVSAESIAEMKEHFRLLEESAVDQCRSAANLPVRDIMEPVGAGIDVDASLGEAVHQLVARQVQSVLVKRGGEVVGLLRLSDLFSEITRFIRSNNVNRA